MLKDSLFFVQKEAISVDFADFSVSFCPEHDIYKAHFPQQAITPGVCLIQMIKELIENVLHYPLRLSFIKNVKFINVLIPSQTLIAQIHCDWTFDENAHTVHVMATVSDDRNLYVKMSLFFNYLPYCVLIPVYNNQHTIVKVITDALRFCPHVLVVNDGSNDNTLQEMKCIQNRVTLVDYSPNHGKGYALKRGFECARAKGFEYVLTMDADGQHLAEDIPALCQAAFAHPSALIVGSRSFSAENMPKQNVKANRFSNFWFTMQTACKLPDTQTGFRIYPLKKMGKMKPLWNRYEAELDLLVRCAWRGIDLVSAPVNVFYPPDNERVSHFRPTRDFLRISLLNTGLCIAAIFYGLPRTALTRLFSHHNA